MGFLEQHTEPSYNNFPPQSVPTKCQWRRLILSESKMIK
jgi:hypothetical protein